MHLAKNTCLAIECESRNGLRCEAPKMWNIKIMFVYIPDDISDDSSVADMCSLTAVLPGFLD